MEYLQLEINKYLSGEITLQQLTFILHHLVDDVVIPDAIYTKSDIEGLRYVSPEVGYVDQDEEYY